MPSYTYRVRKPDPAPVPATIDRKVSRPSTAKLTKVSRPSAAKTVENVPRNAPREAPRDG